MTLMVEVLGTTELFCTCMHEKAIQMKRNDRQGIDCIYQLTVHLLDANQAILDHFSPLPFPIRRGRNSVSSRASHVFSNIKKGVRFVSFERHIWDLEFRNEQYGVCLMNSTVFVRVCLP
ncbi:F-box only protein 27 [Bos taurus]|uniref:F-box only protein 27 n=1 Tax=Bos taurus TaxID=9913 RepID=UPI0028CB9F81|nr:F-box only protein 27 [Bos taurus]